MSVIRSSLVDDNVMEATDSECVRSLVRLVNWNAEGAVDRFVASSADGDSPDCFEWDAPFVKELRARIATLFEPVQAEKKDRLRYY